MHRVIKTKMRANGSSEAWAALIEDVKSWRKLLGYSIRAFRFIFALFDGVL